MPRSLPSKYSIRGFRRALSSIDGVPQFALLGVISGIVTGLAMIAFRALIELPLANILTRGSGNFENLPTVTLFLMPLVGGSLLAILFSLIRADSRRVGVVHVLERLARFQGHLPWQNAVVQYIGGFIALAFGFSGGREGPAIHLGAAGSSFLGQMMKLPNNSIRILVGCGAAAAISASFNTPIAGVIFSMEVILMEYTIAGFIPVILAAVTATLINQTVYGSATAFVVPADLVMNSYYDLPFLVVEGVVIGTIAALFVKLMAFMFKVAPEPFWVKMLIMGLATSLMALICAEIMGVGYDTVNNALAGELPIVVLLAACFFKVLSTATTIALRVPVGVIGPTLFIGATAGGVFGYLGQSYLPDLASNPGFYVVIGMGAMMGAVLQAPLAALLAVIELTQNTHIVLPAMLVIVIANLTASQVFNVKSIFITQMEIMGLEFRQNPLSMTLNRASVASIMSRSFERVARNLSREDALLVARDKPTWLLVDTGPHTTPVFIMPTIDLIAFLDSDKREAIDLKEIPALRKNVSSILLQATLKEALDLINESGNDAIYVNRISAPMIDSVVGIITRQDIESYYQA